MSKQRYTTEKIIHKLRKADVLKGQRQACNDPPFSAQARPPNDVTNG
jgi:hypothetical protein